MADHNVVELEVGGGPRLLLHAKGNRITLLRLGAHDVVDKYKRVKTLQDDLRQADPLDMAMMLGPSVLPSAGVQPPEHLLRYGNETDPRWLYFLDEKQATIAEEILERVEEVLVSDEDKQTLDILVGGPGTGKTSILLQMLDRLSALVGGQRESWDVGLRVSPSLFDQIQSATQWDLSRAVELAEQAYQAGQHLDVLLIDDPDYLAQISRFVSSSGEQPQVKAVIVGSTPFNFERALRTRSSTSSLTFTMPKSAPWTRAIDRSGSWAS